MEGTSRDDGGLDLVVQLTPPGPKGRTHVHFCMTEADFWKWDAIFEQHKRFLRERRAIKTDDQWLTTE